MSIEIKMPTLSPTMTKGLIARWLVTVGDSVNSGDIIAEVETDKVTVEIESDDNGVVSELCVAEGDEVPVDDIIVRLAPAGTAIDKAETTPAKPQEKSESRQEVKAPEADNNAPISEDKIIISDSLNLSPLARRMAEQENIDVSAIVGSGPKGKIIKKDIEKRMGFDVSMKATSPDAAQIPAQQKVVIDYDALPEFTEVKNSGMRSVVANRLTESSRDIPHFHMTVDCEIDALLALRKELNNRENADYKISVNDFVIKAVAYAMKKVPEANCMWAGDSVLHFQQVDISVAVAIKDGLITPVLRNVNGLGLAEVSNNAKSLVEAAREGNLKPSDYQGGTFTISNLGMFGIKEFTSIINPPQNGILSVGMGEQRAVVKNGEITVATVMSVTLAMDHRCVDGAIGARFIQAFKQVIEDPMTLML